MGLKERIKRAQERLPTPDVVPMRDGSSLRLPLGGRTHTYMALFDALELLGEDGEIGPGLSSASMDDPLLQAIIEDRIDLERVRAQDESLYGYLSFLSCFVTPAMAEATGEEG